MREEIVQSLPGFHAITGCDTTSSFSGKGKWKAYQLLLANDNHRLLKRIGDRWVVDPQTETLAEEFVIKLYGSTMENLNLARCVQTRSTYGMI